MIYYLGVRFSETQRRYLKYMVVGLLIFSMLVGMIGVVSGQTFSLLRFLYFHPSRYSSNIVVLSLLYIYLSDWNRKTILSFILFLSFALISGKSKTYGFYTATLYFIALHHFNIKIRFDFKTFTLLSLCLALILFASWEKFFSIS